jgi:hypothetical protein
MTCKHDLNDDLTARLRHVGTNHLGRSIDAKRAISQTATIFGCALSTGIAPDLPHGWAEETARRYFV